MFITDSVKTLEHLTLFFLTTLYVNLVDVFILFFFFLIWYGINKLLLFQQSSTLIMEYIFIIWSFSSSVEKKIYLRTDMCHKDWKPRTDGEKRLIVAWPDW